MMDEKIVLTRQQIFTFCTKSQQMSLARKKALSVFGFKVRRFSGSSGIG
ncbi:hypothetical protein ACLB1E_34185 [Escherichia coli]